MVGGRNERDVVMRGIAGYAIGAIILAILGGACLGASRLDRQMAGAQQALLTADYDGADASLQVVERYYQYASRVPGVGDGLVNDVRARRAAVSYWQRKYSVVAPPDRTDPVADVEAENLPLQMIVADSVYRDRQTRAKDRATLLQALGSSIDAYRTVLSNARRPEDGPYAEVAAYNYEYVVRLRNEILNGRRRELPPPDDKRTFGNGGKPEDPTFDNEFKQYVPLEKEERPDPKASKMPPPPRKG
jgi:hypothetical protein